MEGFPTKSTTEIDKIKAETARVQAETVRMAVSTVGDVLKTIGIIVSLVLASWATCTKADASKVEAAVENGSEAIAVLNENVQEQHAQSEKLREVVQDTTEAVRSIASAASSPAGIPVQNKEPEKSGCWTVYGGIVRCKGLPDRPKSAVAPHPMRIDIPEAPPPAAPFRETPPRGRESF